MIPSDMTIDYLVSSFRHLHSKFWYNSLGSICTYLYLIEGIIVFQSASSSKSNIRIDNPTMLLHPWDPSPSRNMPQGRGQHLRDGPRRPPPWPPPTSKGAPAKVEAQTDSTSFQFRTPGASRTKTDAQVAYGVGFGHSLYGSKDNFKTLPMELVSG